MTTFVIGLVAAGLWIAAAVAVILLTRNSPAPPQRSIRSFRRARRKLAPRPRQVPDLSPRSRTHSLDTVEEIPLIASPVQQVVHEIVEDPVVTTEVLEPEITPDPEFAEISAMLEAVTDESSSQARPHRISPSSKTPPRGPRVSRGPRRAGRHTYVLVDEEGRPQLD